jgi:hypothetical protein
VELNGSKMNDELKKYYEYLKGANADVPPDFDSFATTLSDEKQAKTYFDYLKSNKFDAPETFDSFSETLGLKKKSSPIDLASKGQTVFQELGQPLTDSTTPASPSTSAEAPPLPDLSLTTPETKVFR